MTIHRAEFKCAGSVFDFQWFWVVSTKLSARSAVCLSPPNMSRPDHCIPDSKVYESHMGPTWVLSAPYGPHVVPMNHANRDVFAYLMNLPLPMSAICVAPICSVNFSIIWQGSICSTVIMQQYANMRQGKMVLPKRGTRPTNGFSIEFIIRSKFGVLWSKIC